jgi:hypothetical protein
MDSFKSIDFSNLIITCRAQHLSRIQAKHLLKKILPPRQRNPPTTNPPNHTQETSSFPYDFHCSFVSWLQELETKKRTKKHKKNPKENERWWVQCKILMFHHLAGLHSMFLLQGYGCFYLEKWTIFGLPWHLEFNLRNFWFGFGSWF